LINLRRVEVAKADVHEVPVIEAQSRARAVSWGFIILLVTIVIGIGAYVTLDALRLETNTLREWLQTTIAGEIGLLAGLLGSPHDRRST
jgi:hypothetical protein